MIGRHATKSGDLGQINLWGIKRLAAYPTVIEPIASRLDVAELVRDLLLRGSLTRSTTRSQHCLVFSIALLH